MRDMSCEADIEGIVCRPGLSSRLCGVASRRRQKLVRDVGTARRFWCAFDDFPHAFGRDAVGTGHLDEARRDGGADLRLDQQHRPDVHPHLTGDMFGREGRPVFGPNLRQVDRDQKPLTRLPHSNLGDTGFAEVKRGELRRVLSCHGENGPEEYDAGESKTDAATWARHAGCRSQGLVGGHEALEFLEPVTTHHGLAAAALSSARCPPRMPYML